MLSYVRQNFPHGHNAKPALQWALLLLALLICIAKGIELLGYLVNSKHQELELHATSDKPLASPFEAPSLATTDIGQNKEVQTEHSSSLIQISDLPILIGIVKSNQTSAYAVLKVGTQQGVYSVGESIKLDKSYNDKPYRVTVDSIGMKHIVVSRKELKYQLPLVSKEAEHEQADKLRTPSAIQTTSTLARRNHRAPLAKANVPQLRALLLKAPMSLSRYIQISEQHNNGNLTSYRLQPGVDRHLFDSAGLLPNDEISHIEDLAVKQFKLGKLPALLARGQLSVTLLRDNKPYNVHFTF